MEEIVFIGGGNMASALIGGLIAGGTAPAHISVVDPSSEQLERLAQTYSVNTFPSADVAALSATVVVWAVKPQVLREATLSLRDATSTALHISIAAGVRLQDLTYWLQSERIVRAMPNTASMVGAGVAGLLAGSAVSASDRDLTERLLRSTGETFWVESDEEMNAVTAVSGSGPAYVFHFLEGFQQAAERVGFGTDQAHQLALLVVGGAVKQATQSKDSFAELRQKVTSKRGTTEAALLVLDGFFTQRALVEAIEAARDRGRVLGVELGEDPQ